MARAGNNAAESAGKQGPRSTLGRLGAGVRNDSRILCGLGISTISSSSSSRAAALRLTPLVDGGEGFGEGTDNGLRGKDGEFLKGIGEGLADA